MEKRKIEEGKDFSLEDISPSAAWKEAVFRFETNQKMLPESFCRCLAEQAWQKYSDFTAQKKIMFMFVLSSNLPIQMKVERDGWDGQAQGLASQRTVMSLPRTS